MGHRRLCQRRLLRQASDRQERHTVAERGVNRAMHTTMRRFLAFFIPAATAATIGSLVLYAAIQQDLRKGADDPQHQLAEDAVARLTAGDAPSAVVGSGDVDIAKSLDPFLIVYDEHGTGFGR